MRGKDGSTNRGRNRTESNRRGRTVRIEDNKVAGNESATRNKTTKENKDYGQTQMKNEIK